MEEEKVLVTGADGFLGSVLVNALLDAGHDVYSLGRRPRPSGAHHFVADLCDFDQIRKVLNGYRFSSVVHAAASADRSFDKDAGYRNNFCSTENIVRFASNSNVDRFIFLSSNAVFGRAYSIISGDFVLPPPLSPLDWYAQSKVDGEQFIAKNSPPLRSLVLRLPSVLGVNRKADNIIVAMARSLRDNGIIEIYGRGNARRQFLSAGDLGKVILHALDLQFGSFCTCVSVVSDEVITLADLARKMLKVAGQGRIDFHIERQDSPDQYVDPAPFTKLFGFQPEHCLDESLPKIWQAMVSGT